MTPSTIPFKVAKKEATVTPPVKPPVRVPTKPKNVLLDELPFPDGVEPDLEDALR